MAVIEIARIQVRRGQELQTGVPQLEPGEFGWAQDTENLYIGKRISEGAVDDNNTRILTENDISNIFSLLNITSTATILTPYQYRPEASYISSATISRFIQNKLDEYVSLTEFGVVSSFTATDISTEFQTAVNTLFLNGTFDSYERNDARRELKIPPGNYYISSAIELPPYAVIKGESPELTKLTLVSSTTNIFRTIDADGNTFEDGMQSGVKRSRSVVIKDLTLEYEDTKNSDNALISLDNVLDARVENCILRTAFDSTSTTTYGLVTDGVGIEIRGTGGGLGSGDVNLCENSHIENCRFDGLYIGVRSTGTVIRPVIVENIFSNMNRGVEIYTIDTLPGPSNSLISDNRFENVVREAVYIGPNIGPQRGNHMIKDNFFIQVGNGVGLDDNITSSTDTTPVLALYSPGNQCIDNFFHRKFLADSTSSSNFYYAPLVVGSTVIDNSETTTATISGSTTGDVCKLSVNGQDQFFSVRYQMYNDKLSRKGELIVNVAPDGYSAITDNFNFIESYDPLVGPAEIIFDTSDAFLSKNYVKLTCINSSTDVVVEYTVNTMI